MRIRRLIPKKFILVSLVISLIVTFVPIPQVRAQKATSAVQDTINALLTNNVPNITETKIVSGNLTFTHPGIGVSKAMLDNVQSHVRAGDEPWASAFVQFSSYGKTQKKPNPLRIVLGDTEPYEIPSGGNPSAGLNIIKNMAQDADTAYAQYIMWYVTGDESYRKNSIYIIRRWMQATSIGSIYDEQIRVSLAVFKFAMVADLLRSSSSTVEDYNWTEADTVTFTNYLNLMKSKYDRFWHFMNQHSMNTMAMMSSAIFRNDAADYALAVQRTTTNPEDGSSYDFADVNNPHNRDGSIISQIRSVTTNVSTGETVPANLQLVEMGRDQAHAYNNISGLADTAITSYIQGTKVDPVLGTISTASNSVNMFNFLNDRLLYGANYLTKYNLGYDVTYIPTYGNQTVTGHIFTAPSTVDRGAFYNGFGVVYGYYKYIEKRTDMETNENTKYLTEAYNLIYPEGASQDYIGDGVLLYTLSPVTRLQSYNNPTRYLRHSGFRAALDLNANVTPVEDAQFRIVTGLADSKGFSFESVNYPGRYLNVRSNGEVWIDVNDNTSTFKNNATFRRVPGLADSNMYSYQMWTDSTRYLRHTDFLMHAQSGSGTTFNGDATFAEVTP
ncbi:AbfB domain-containing protein [Paenibacillus sp. 2KB_22]|uniref:AbfB domain-containing protein n=1 Tax=Paenibacillus sp. 2KB_22 TaxID=3232978 RepID=UPI003F97B042